MKPRKTHVKKAAVGFLLLLFLFLTAQNLSSRGGKEKEEEGSKPVKVTASGRVRLTGNSPMPALVISGEDREWEIVQQEKNKLMHLQQQTVTVSGNEYYVDYFFANGISAGRHYFLKDITVISVP